MSTTVVCTVRTILSQIDHCPLSTKQGMERSRMVDRSPESQPTITVSCFPRPSLWWTSPWRPRASTCRPTRSSPNLQPAWQQVRRPAQVVLSACSDYFQALFAANPCQVSSLALQYPHPPPPAPDRHPQGRGLRGPADRGQVHVPRHRQRLLGQAARRAEGRVSREGRRMSWLRLEEGGKVGS